MPQKTRTDHYYFFFLFFFRIRIARLFYLFNLCSRVNIYSKFAEVIAYFLFTFYIQIATPYIYFISIFTRFYTCYTHNTGPLRTLPEITGNRNMAELKTEEETATAPAAQVRYCGPRETRFTCPVPRCTFRSTGILQSLKRHFDLKHKDLAWGGLSVTCTKCNTLMPPQCSLKKVSEHFRVCTAVQPIITTVATPLKYACPICQVRWPSVTAARSHYYQMHHGAPTLNDIDFGAGTPTPKR